MKALSWIKNILQAHFPKKSEFTLFWFSFFIFFGMVFFPDLQLTITKDQYFPYGPYLLTSDVISNIFSWFNISQNEELSLKYPWSTIAIQKFWFHLFDQGPGYFWGRASSVFMIHLLMYKIVRRSLNILYTVFILHFSLICFSNFPFRLFFSNLIQGKFELPYTEATITGFPFPLVSITGFLLALTFSTRRKKHSVRSLYIQSLLWFMQASIHPLSFILGLPIAILTLVKSLEKISKDWKTYFFHITILSLGLWQTSKYLFSNIARPSLQDFELIQNSPFNIFTTFYFSFYCLIPSFLTILVFLIRKINPREIGMRFGHIYTLMLTEMIILLADSLFFKGLYGQWIFSRFFIFLHLLYFIPFIYYFNAPQYFVSKRGIEGYTFLRKIDHFLKFFFFPLKNLIPAIALIFLWIFSWNSQIKRRNQYFKYMHSSYERFAKDLNNIQGNEIVVNGSYQNLFLILNSKRNPLWGNNFFSNQASEEIIQRYALNFKIYALSNEEFINFFKEGIGSNFAFHKEFTMGYRLNNFKLKQLKDVFKNTNLQSSIEKFGIRKIYSLKLLENLPSFFHGMKLKHGYLYTREKN